MTYSGWVRRRRLERAARRFEYPVWRPFIHERLLKIELLRNAYPHVREIIVADDRAN